ncbi:MAG: PD-(D/E)XK nuclease family protein [Sphingomonadales bacterium]|nr:PD-(D/E)XK nuclease family protein [Sphingomonadales bacterium]
MVEGRPQHLFTIPVGTDISSAVASQLISEFKDDPLALTDVTLLLSNNRAITAMTKAFVVHSDKGLLLPKMVAIGDLALDEKLSVWLDPIVEAEAAPWPVIEPVERQIVLANLIRRQRPQLTPVEVLKLSRRIAEAIDQLEVEEIALDRFDDGFVEPDLALHWSDAYRDFRAILTAYGAQLEQRKLLSPAVRRKLLLNRLAKRLEEHPLATPVWAVGISTAAPAVVRVLKAIAQSPCGAVILPNLDIGMPDFEWDAIGSVDPSGDEMRRTGDETHPQFHQKLLLHRMAIMRSEFALFPGCKDNARAKTISQAFCTAPATADWRELPAALKKLGGCRTMLCADSAEEARAIALLVRQALETSERTVAIITPDRELAKRVAAQLLRWGVAVDDSAGNPLLKTVPGSLLVSVATMLETHFGPVPLLSVLKHPLVKAGEPRAEWLRYVRQLDLVFRGPRLGIGCDGITQAIDSEQKVLIEWWQAVVDQMPTKHLPDSFAISHALALISDTMTALTDGEVWKGVEGRALASALEALQRSEIDTIGPVQGNNLSALITQLLNREVVRSVYGTHPRVAIYGLLEARLQQADLVICGGLNEGTWPQIAQPDPWLAPRVRRELGLPGLERSIGLSAHDLQTLLGGTEVVLSRSERDRTGPTIASRFLLRLQALLGSNLQIESEALRLARALDSGLRLDPIEPPSVSPDAQQRLVPVSVTQIDTLRADPFAFYASKILNLRVLRDVDSEPDAAWRGTAIHAVIEEWTLSDKLEPTKLIERADALLTSPAVSPVVRALWQPRITAALKWLAEETLYQFGEGGRTLLSAESFGSIPLAGVRLSAKADRIDRDADGGLVVIDYKTGSAPPTKKIAAGYALQLGLAGAIAEQGGFAGISGKASGFEYWTLNKRSKGDGFGEIKRPLTLRGKDIDLAADFTGFVIEIAEKAISDWITGTRPFTSQLTPEYAVGTDYNHLARVREWYGRRQEDQR